MYRELFKNTNFIKLYIARCISSFGDSLDDIAFAMLVYKITQSTLLTSYVFVIKIIFSFTSIFTAVLADRLNKKLMIFIGEISQGILLIVLLLLNMYSKVNVITLILFVTLQAFFSTICNPAKNALITFVIEKKSLLAARSLINTSVSFIEVLAYGISAVLIGYIGIYKVIFIDAITFIISSMIFLTLNYKELIIPFKDIKEYKCEVKLGFSFVTKNKLIFIILFISLLGNMFMSPVTVLMPAYFNEPNFSNSSFSIFMTIVTIGGIISGILLPYINKKVKDGVLLTIGFAFGALGVCMLSLLSSNIATYISAIFIGISFSLVSILNANIIQILTPNNMMARVFSIFKFSSYIAGPIGMLLSGLLGEYINIKYVFLILGVGMILVTSLSYVKLIIKKMDMQGLNECIEAK